MINGFKKKSEKKKILIILLEIDRNVGLTMTRTLDKDWASINKNRV